MAAMRAALLDEAAPVFERYRALFGLRNAGGRGAVDALGAAFAGRSALLKHEVAYVLGQMQDAGAVETLRCAARGGGSAIYAPGAACGAGGRHGYRSWLRRLQPCRRQCPVRASMQGLHNHCITALWAAHSSARSQGS